MKRVFYTEQVYRLEVPPKPEVVRVPDDDEFDEEELDFDRFGDGLRWWW